MRLSVRVKQAGGVTVLVAGVVVTLSVMHLAALVRLTLGENQARGELLANAIFHRAHEVVAGGGEPRDALRHDRGVSGILESSVYSPNMTYAAITDESGTAMAHSDPLMVGRPVPDQPALEQLLAQGTVGQLRALYPDAGMFEVRTPLLIDGRAFGTIRIGVSMVLARRDLERSIRPALVTAAAAFAIAAILALVLAHSLLRPVHLITSGLSRLGRGEFGVTLDLPQRDEFGELGAFFNTVSAQVSADRNRLAGQTATVESLIERFEEGVGFFGVHGDLLFANAAMLAALPDDPVGRRIQDLLPPDHPYRELVERCLSESSSQGPLTIPVPAPLASAVSPSGEPSDRPSVDLLITAHAIDGPDGQRGGGGVMLVARNLADLTEVQSTINLSQRLTALARLTTGVAHEMKNPLNAMGIHLELIRHLCGAAEAGGEVDTAAVRNHADVIAASLRRLDDVVQVFLKFTRPEDVRLQPTSVVALLQHILPIVEAEAGAKRIAVSLTCAPDTPPARADAAMLEQAFLNLALNACQAMPDGGRLRISASGAPGRYVQIRFEDTGVGIPPEHLDKVFNLYFTTKEGGSGIGLSMVYRTVQLHDGEIEVQSSPGQGTLFRVLVPQA